MTATHWLFIAVELAAFALIPVILVGRREPVSTYAWILTLVFLPVLGAVLYLLFGRASLRMDAVIRAAAEGGQTGRPGSTGLAEDAFRFARALTGDLPSQGNRCVLYTDGDATFAAIGAAIDAATQEIAASYYLIRNDNIGAWFSERIAAAASRGVRVRLLIDGYGSLGVGWRWVRQLRAAGVRVARFSPVTRLLWASPNLRNHRKIVVVDGRIGFTGGVNISALHSAARYGAAAWKDFHLRISGPAAASLLHVFERDWHYATGEALPQAAPASPAEQEAIARIAVVAGGPDTRLEAIHRVILAAIGGARRRISIVSPYFCADESILLALELSAMRGVDTELLLPSRSNHLVTFHAGRSCYDRLLAAGVRIAEYTPGMIHAKAILVDDELAMVGSSNLDLRSFRLNFEIQVLIDDPELIRELGAAIAECHAHSLAMRLGPWRARGLRLRLGEGAARLLSPLL